MPGGIVRRDTARSSVDDSENPAVVSSGQRTADDRLYCRGKKGNDVGPERGANPCCRTRTRTGSNNTRHLPARLRYFSKTTNTGGGTFLENEGVFAPVIEYSAPSLQKWFSEWPKKKKRSADEIEENATKRDVRFQKNNTSSSMSVSPKTHVV